MPFPLPDDDLELMSDFLLSLETREDLTSHILDQTEARDAIIGLANREIGDDSKFNFKVRAAALLQYWDKLYLQRSKLSPAEALADTHIPPLKKELPAGKTLHWKLTLTDQQAHEAQEDYDHFKHRKLHALKYFKANPPQPIGWAPKNDNAWKTVNRAKLENGDLYDNPNFKPMYSSWDLLSTSALFWTDPEATAEELKEDEERQKISTELSLRKAGKILERHKRREEQRAQRMLQGSA